MPHCFYGAYLWLSTTPSYAAELLVQSQCTCQHTRQASLCGRACSSKASLCLQEGGGHNATGKQLSRMPTSRWMIVLHSSMMTQQQDTGVTFS